MNVIVSNLNKDKLVNLSVDVIKSMSGEFEVEEIVQSFSNFFFNKMFLDITSIKDYTNLSNMQKLSIGLDVDKIILFIGNDTTANSKVYLSKLISMGMYNFAKDETEAMYLYNNPNSYRDVAHLQKVDDPIVESVSTTIISNGVRVIGFKNYTEDAGATSLIYMLKMALSKIYSVIAIEVNKTDFLFYNDKNMISVNSAGLSNAITKHKNYNVILVDLNDLDESLCNNICSDVIYLVEPSLFKINKMIMLNRKAFDKISNEKIILNKSFFNDKDIKDFEFEANIKVFYNIPCLNDRINNNKIFMPLFEKLGLVRRS